MFWECWRVAGVGVWRPRRCHNQDPFQGPVLTIHQPEGEGNQMAIAPVPKHDFSSPGCNGRKLPKPCFGRVARPQSIGQRLDTFRCSGLAAFQPLLTNFYARCIERNMLGALATNNREKIMKRTILIGIACLLANGVAGATCPRTYATEGDWDITTTGLTRVSVYYCGECSGDSVCTFCNYITASPTSITEVYNPNTGQWVETDSSGSCQDPFTDTCLGEC